MPENNNLDSANGAPCSYTTGDGSLRWPCAVHPPNGAGEVALPPLPQTIAWATVNPSLATAVDDLRRAAVLADLQQRAGDVVQADTACHKALVQELGKVIHDMVISQQAAWIEWQHGKGAEAAMSWIGNGLAGPGHIPDETEPYGKEAQAWYDANKADPFPACHCGRPSNILHMGSGYCSQEHYRAALTAPSRGDGNA